MNNSKINLIIIGIVIILAFLMTLILLAQEIAVPIEVQFPIFLKILTFDRNFKTRVGDEIVIGIVYQKKFKRSLIVKDELINVINNSAVKKVENIPIRQVSIDIDKTDLESINKVDVLYITPIRALAISNITMLSQAKKIMTFTGVPNYVELGIAGSIGIKGGKPLIIINLPAAKAENVNFSSQLLKLAKVIK